MTTNEIYEALKNSILPKLKVIQNELPNDPKLSKIENLLLEAEDCLEKAKFELSKVG